MQAYSEIIHKPKLSDYRLYTCITCAPSYLYHLHITYGYDLHILKLLTVSILATEIQFSCNFLSFISLFTSILIATPRTNCDSVRLVIVCLVFHWLLTGMITIVPIRSRDHLSCYIHIRDTLTTFITFKFRFSFTPNISTQIRKLGSITKN